MDVHGTGLPVEIIAPDMAQKLISREDDALIFHQIFQDLKFL